MLQIILGIATVIGCYALVVGVCLWFRRYMQRRRVNRNRILITVINGEKI